MEDGYTIRIEDPRKKYDPAEFWIENFRVWTFAPEIGTWQRDDNCNEEMLNNHFAEMLKNGLSVIIKKQNHSKKKGA